MRIAALLLALLRGRTPRLVDSGELARRLEAAAAEGLRGQS